LVTVRVWVVVIYVVVVVFLFLPRGPFLRLCPRADSVSVGAGSGAAGETGF
jgi:hypothetical protein